VAKNGKLVVTTTKSTKKKKKLPLKHDVNYQPQKGGDNSIMVVYHAFSQYLVFVFFMFYFHIPFHSHLPPLAFNLFFLLFKLLTVNIITTKIVGTIKLL
jgi:hypothetical protein